MAKHFTVLALLFVVGAAVAQSGEFVSHAGAGGNSDHLCGLLQASTGHHLHKETEACLIWCADCPKGFTGPECALCSSDAGCAEATGYADAKCNTDLSFYPNSEVG